MSEHGTNSMYTNGRCRCDLCKAASSVQKAGYYVVHQEKIRAFRHAYRAANLEKVQAQDLVYRTFKRPILRLTRRIAGKQVRLEQLKELIQVLEETPA